MPTTPFSYRFRNALATLPSLLILSILIIAGVQKAVKIERHVDEATVQISLSAPEPEPESVPKPPTPPTPVNQPTVKPISQPTARQETVTNSPSAEVAAAVPVALNTPVTNPTPTPTLMPTPAPVASAAEPAKPNNASIEAGYIAKLRAHLNSIKRYPTGREASQQKPQGKVKVWFVLSRNGAVVEQGIEESSNSMLLDDAAKKTINRSSFTAFPESSWAGEATHKFSAELDFIPAAA
ncbi:TonB family protein [Solimicrobium silvestre]|uniref:TonB family C-terminal domain n=1 Tax=Solimicrobium silvestre TaxID=2099400 RepID=A0A2S9H3X4_9BURK|nr:TonB family protein [Solimicrobium silvestre]PRC94685.1 TonB family C-terminal domain [Solimicrobium silvestre]